MPCVPPFPPLVLALALLQTGVPATPPRPRDGADADLRIRIDADAVRLAVGLNLAFLDRALDLPQARGDAVPPGEEAALETALVARLREETRIVVDGIEVTPLVAPGSFACEDADPALLPDYPLLGARALARVRLVLAASLQAPPRSVAVTWSAFPPPAAGAPPRVLQAWLVANGEDSLVRFTPDAPTVTWSGAVVPAEQRFLDVPGALPPPAWSVPVPTLALALAAVVLAGLALRGRTARRTLALRLAFLALALGAALEPWGHARVPDPLARDRGLPDAEGALAVFRPLHANIYRAFDYDSEDDVYDALARSVEGPLLAELYGAIYASLAQGAAGGARSRVHSVELEEADVHDIGRDGDGDPAFSVDARWRVEGVVFHWGHAHVRCNEYRARYRVRQGEAGWRIAGCRTLEERLVDAAPLQPAGSAAPPGGFPARALPDAAGTGATAGGRRP